MNTTRLFLQTIYNALSLGRCKENLLKAARVFLPTLSKALSLVQGGGSTVRTTRFFLTYLVAIAGAELITALVNQLGGMIFHFIILVSLIVNSVISRKVPSQRLFLFMGLAPLIRILNLSLPLVRFSEVYWFLIVSIPLLSGIIVIIMILNINPTEIALTTGKIRFQSAIALTGIGIGLVDYLILKPEPLITSMSWQEMVAPVLILLISTGFVEELTFRGLIQSAAEQVLVGWGWIYTAVLYSVLQIGHLSVVHCLFTLIIALYFGWIVKKTGSLLGVSLAHGLINITLYLVFPFII